MKTKTIFPDHPMLPWVEGREDRLFKRLLIVLVLLFLVAGIVVNRLQLPELQQKELADVAPRLAKLILDKKVTPPPPPPLKKVIKKEQPVVKKEPEKAKQKKPLTQVDRKAAARETAQKSGLIALKDELADLRESFDFSDIADKPQQKTGKQAESVLSTSDLLVAKATQGSGGIKTDTLNRQLRGSELASRKTTSVKSSLPTADSVSRPTVSKKGANTLRSQEEIEIVFQKNKGAIFNIYNRELRKDPALQGKIVLELTIQPDGSVSQCIIVSSELNHQKLERRLVSKIKNFVFESKDVPVLTVTYPIDFLPS